ncbi:MAG: PQQ-binding-like beta-propeller repeat protein [Myxococcota bacterium]
MPSCARLAFALLLSGGLAAGAAHAHDIELPIAGDSVVLKTGKKPKHSRFEFEVSGQPEVGPRHDPAEAGLSLLVRGVGENGGHTGLIDLVPEYWTPIGPTESPTGYRYDDPEGTQGGVREFVLTHGGFTIEARGESWPWMPAGAQDAVEVFVTIEEELFCASFGGKVTQNRARHFRARDAAAPDHCAESVCGNGELELGEECDDGNLNEVDGCTSACAIGPCELASGIDSTFEAIQAQIFDSDVYGCTNLVCHGGATGQGNLRLVEGESYDNLVSVDAFGSTAPRVLPGEPEQSYLFQLLSAATLGTEIPGGGTPMPTGGGRALTEAHLEGVKTWIRGGAPRDAVVEGTAELLGSCLPEPDPLTIPVPEPPFPGFGVQLQQTPWPLPASSEDEICMSTYYDFSALVPEWAKVPCPPEMLTVNNPSGECFAYHRQVLSQDPQSHHSIIHNYLGRFRPLNPDWGEYTKKYPDASLNGEPCHPKEIDPALGYNPNCSGAVVSSIACIGYGPPDYTFGTGVGLPDRGTAPAFSGSQEPFFEQEFAPGVYGILPVSGVVVWNSHAFNLTSGDSTMNQYLNLHFAGRGDQLFPARAIFDSDSIFTQFVLPFESREYCRTYEIPLGAELFRLSSHTHRHGKLFRVWDPPNTACVPGEPACVPRDDAPTYFSTEYEDPVQLAIEPPIVHTDPSPESRSYLYCSVYDNGDEVDGSGRQVYPVKRQSTSPAPPLVFGLPLGPGGPCSNSEVECLDGPHKGERCGGDDSLCDSSPGAGDGVCDACPLRGGVTTEDEMFILLGDYYIDDGSSAGTEITPENVSALGVKWDFPLPAGVTSSPTVTENFVYASSWDGFVYALNKETGEPIWSFDTGTSGILGVQSTVMLAPGGQVLFGDSQANVYMLDGESGAVLWQRSLGNPAVAHIWSSATIEKGRVFFGVASHSDQPCGRGRLVALDLATGEELWTRLNLPDRICRNDTSVECATDADCGGESCVRARGAGVTATVATDPAGDFVYMNTIGCFTFPSVGDSDSILKLDAATGETIWSTRVDPPEQFGYCANSPAGAPPIECGSDAMCGAAGPCRTKPFYHDFGFVNGPIPIEVPAAGGGTKTLLVSGSKNGTLYALNEADGNIAWQNAVLPKPETPAFAGFGLFNGALDVEDGRIFAALYEFFPPANPAPPHLMAFDAEDGSIAWSAEIGPSWGHVEASNGVVFTGTNAAPVLYAYDAETGQRRAEFPLPAITTSKPTVEETSLYVGYGVFGGTGGVRAYILP